jgi:hypothetical protein
MVKDYLDTKLHTPTSGNKGRYIGPGGKEYRTMAEWRAAVDAHSRAQLAARKAKKKVSA